MRPYLFSLALISISTALLADPIKVGDTGVTFEAPENFNPLGKELIATKWPTNQAPDFAVGTASGSTAIAYSLKPHHISQEALPKAQKSFTKSFERLIPGIDWKKNELIEHSGQKWLLMEMTSSAVDTDIHNIIMMTGFDGKMLLFNFNSTKEDFPKHEAALRKSVNSVKLPKIIAAPPSDADCVRLLLGRWTSHDNPGEVKVVTTFKPAGALSKEVMLPVINQNQKSTIKVEGNWRVEGGILIEEVTSSSQPKLFPPGMIFSDTLISVTEKQYRTRSEKGDIDTNVRVSEDPVPTATK